MSCEQKLLSAFRSALALPWNYDAKLATPDSILQWDSIGHLQLVGEIELAFGVDFRPGEVLSLDSYERAKELLRLHSAWVDSATDLLA